MSYIEREKERVCEQPNDRVALCVRPVNSVIDRYYIHNSEKTCHQSYCIYLYTSILCVCVCVYVYTYTATLCTSSVYYTCLPGIIHRRAAAAAATAGVLQIMCVSANASAYKRRVDEKGFWMYLCFGRDVFRFFFSVLLLVSKCYLFTREYISLLT